VKLTKLEIKGFKSFGDKIAIHFNEGVTAIVGPNGCGKSNVVDAIRWAMGEQSTRTLRSEKMENVIFNGTANRKPAHLAEVSLTFENNRELLPTEFATVTITRKLYRNGESEYRLNDVKCRLKDITDLFLDTGLGADSYAIIELKMVDEIINNKENSRRHLFEEASGISKYKVRKKQSLARLKDTEADLARIEDVLHEIAKNLQQLEAQAKKADRYFRLKNEYKASSIALAYCRLEHFSNDLQHISRQEKALRESSRATNEKIEQAENRLRSLREDILAKEKNLAVQQKSAHGYADKIRSYEADRKIQNERMRHLLDKEERLTTELSADKKQLEHVQHTLKRLNETLFEEQAKLEAFRADVEKHQTSVEELRRQQTAAKAKWDGFAHRAAEGQAAIHRLEKSIAVLNIQREALQQEAQRTLTDTASKADELDGFDRAVAELEERTDREQNEHDEAMAAETELQRQIQAAERRLDETRQQINRDARLLDAKQNEYNLTKSLVDNLEGFPESIRFLRKNAGWAKPHPLFSDILFCREEYRVAIENHLEPVMNHYVVENRQEAVRAVQLLGDSARGRAGFFVLDAVGQAGDAPPADPPADAIPALEVVSVDEKYAPLCRRLLQNVFILKPGSSADLADNLPSTEAVILHPEGKFAKNRLGLSGGSVGLFEGKRIGRAKNLVNLAKEIKEINQKIENLQDLEDESLGKLSSLRSASRKDLIDERRTVLNRLQNELVSVRTKQEQYRAFISSGQTRKEDIEAKITAIGGELRQAEAELQALKSTAEVQQAQSAEQQAAYADITDLLAEKSTAFNQENIRFHQQQHSVSSLQKDTEYRESQHGTLEQRIAKNDSELGRLRADMKEALPTVEHEDEDLTAMYAQKEALEEGLRELEADFYASRKTINDLEEEVVRLRRNKDQDDFLLSELKDKKTALQIDLNALKERLSVEFNIDIHELLHGEPPQTDASEDELSATCDKLRKQLESYGSINPTAKEAYDQMNERHTFIAKEKADLLEAEADLRTTISEIDRTARDKFMAAFNAVRHNFVAVFRSLFNQGDSCDMLLTDPDDPLSSDIDIIARPKGKRPLSINQLSGGEKTLTATALLFALYLLKPAPFCIFDEVDAPLDDTNIDKFNNIIRDFSKNSQFIIVSHNKRTIAGTDIMYGVTMVEQGVSRVVPVDLRIWGFENLGI